MEFFNEFAPVAAIAVIAFLFGLIAKQVKFIPDRWIPVICALVGAAFSIPAMQIMPEFPGDNWITAIAYGIVSGLAAVGGHQIYKQLTAPVAITIPAYDKWDENGDPIPERRATNDGD